MNGEHYLNRSLSNQNTSRVQSLTHINKSTDPSDGLTDHLSENGIINRTLLYRDAYFQHPGLAYRRHSVTSPYEQAISGLEWSATWRSAQCPREISYTPRTEQVPTVVRSVEEAVRILLGENPVSWTSSGSDPDRNNHTASQNITSAYIMAETRAKTAPIRKSLDDALKRIADSRQRLAQLMSLKSESSGQKNQNHTASGQDKHFFAKRTQQHREGSEIAKNGSKINTSSTRTDKNNPTVNAPNQQSGTSLSVLPTDTRSETAKPGTEEDKVSSAEKEPIKNGKGHCTDTDTATERQTEVTSLSTASDTTRESRACMTPSSKSRINKTFRSFLIKPNQILPRNKKATRNSLSDKVSDKACDNIDGKMDDKGIRETTRRISYLNTAQWRGQYMTSEHMKGDQKPKPQTSKNRTESILYLTQQPLTTCPHTNTANYYEALRVSDQKKTQIEPSDRNKDRMCSSSQRNDAEASKHEHLSETHIVGETSSDDVTITWESTMPETGNAVTSENKFTPSVRRRQQDVSPDVTDEHTDDHVTDVTDEHTDDHVTDVTDEQTDDHVTDVTDEQTDDHVTDVTDEHTDDHITDVTDEQTDDHVADVTDVYTDDHITDVTDVYTDGHVTDVTDKHTNDHVTDVTDEHTNDHVTDVTDEHTDDHVTDVTDEHTGDHVTDATDEHTDDHVTDVTDEHTSADNMWTQSVTIIVTDDKIDNTEEQSSTVKLSTPESGERASDDRFDRYVHHSTDVTHSDMQGTDSNTTNCEAVSLARLLSVSDDKPYEDQVIFVEKVCPETLTESSSNLMASKPPEGQEVIQRSLVLHDTPAGQEAGTSQTNMSTDEHRTRAESIGDVTSDVVTSELGQTSPENGYLEVGSDLLTGDLRVEKVNVSRMDNYLGLSTCDSENYVTEVPPRLEPYMFVKSSHHVISPEETLKRIEMLKRRRRCLSAGNLLEADTENEVNITDTSAEREDSVQGEIERIKELQHKKEIEIEARLATKLGQEENSDPRGGYSQRPDVNDVSSDYSRSEQIERTAEKLDWYRHKRQTADNMCNARLNRLLAGVGQRFLEHQSEVISKYISPTSRAAAFVLSGARHTSRDSALGSRLSSSTDRLHLCGSNDQKPKYRFYTSNPFDV